MITAWAFSSKSILRVIQVFHRASYSYLEQLEIDYLAKQKLINLTSTYNEVKQ